MHIIFYNSNVFLQELITDEKKINIILEIDQEKFERLSIETIK